MDQAVSGLIRKRAELSGDYPQLTIAWRFLRCILPPMSIRYWLYAAALGGCLIASTPLAAQESGQQPTDNSGQLEEHPNVELGEQQETVGNEATPQAASVLRHGLATTRQHIEAGAEQAQDSRANYYTRHDLLAQESMARSTEKLVELTSRQIIIGAVEAILLLGTIGLSLWAAIAASKAARAAERAADISRLQTRPWLTMSVSLTGEVGIEQTDPTQGMRINAHVRIVNVGASLAKNARVHTEAFNQVGIDGEETFRQFFRDQIEKAAADQTYGDILAPTDETTMNYGTFIRDVDLMRRHELENGAIIVAPSVAVIVTYRDFEPNSELLYTARVYHLIAQKDGVAYSVDLQKLPIQTGQAELISLPIHAQAN